MQPDQYFQRINDADNINTLQLTIAPEWGQGRTAFGGLTAGLLYQALKNVVVPARKLRSITFNFVAPVVAGEPIGFSWQILRQGKNATQVTASILQGDQVCLTALGCFAEDRKSKIDIPAPPTALPPPPDPDRALPYVAGLAPEFLQYIDMVFSDGGLPFSGSKSAHHEGWMRFKTAPERLTDAHIITLIDVWPPTVLQMLEAPAPGSTMSWNVEFVHPHQEIAPESWLAYRANTVQAYGGYAHTEATVYDDAGELIAISRQLVAVFDSR